ncbi:DUF1573 domain-containing protein [Paenimyroides baculatum]|uniref:DUF1573 domain-containing protein n=1 Tax=Paenimyroides baculatum TaxID=2608000 RepID=A0A5M6CNQ8_9FLAO|nr:DUF1573 domain-containing protein [Paenimyroides baculatum]KAA5536020.1 DUF1573 domain-containing protein [Paenimyroides baculatum]
MKILKTSLIALSLMVIPASASVLNVNNIIENVADAVISWKSETIDVGEIPQGTPKNIKFEFTNATSKTVLITNVKAACGCTATDYSKESIAPGKTGYVNAIYNAASAGSFTKSVTVTTSDSDSAKQLTFKGTVVAK